MNIERINPQDLTVARFLALFELFPRTEQLKIARTLWQKTFAEQWMKLDAELPDTDISDDEILTELMAVRYGETANN